MRRLLVALAGVLLVVALAGPAGGQSELDQARQRAREAAEASDAARLRAEDARARAEDAAAALEEAEGRLEQIEEDLAAANDRVARSEDELRVLDVQIREFAATRFVLQPRLGFDSLLGNDDINAGVRAQALARFAVLGTGEEVDRYRAITEDLERDRERVEVLLVEQQAAVARTEVVVGQLEHELDEMTAELEEAEAQEAVFQEEVSRLEEEERRRLEAERQRRLEEERRRRAAEEAARQATSTTTTEAPATTDGSDDGSDGESGDSDDGSDSDDGTGDVEEVADSEPAPTTTEPPPPEPEVVGDGGFLCPIAGPTVFTDSWGAPRSGGRSHKGVDMFADRGTPVVASVSGTVTHRDNSLGGHAYWLFGDDGHSYYGAHLDSYAQSGYVEAGTIVGYVGNSGNARNASPHLHFEVHPHGGSAVNPTPTVRAAC